MSKPHLLTSSFLAQCPDGHASNQLALLEPNHYLSNTRSLFFREYTICYKTSGPVPVSPRSKWRHYLGGAKANGGTGINSREFFSLAIQVLYLIGFGIVQYFAALCEWESGERKPRKFTVDAHLNTYKCHIATLDKIERARNTSYHNMMAEIYQFAV